jgi:hypothetical protein
MPSDKLDRDKLYSANSDDDDADLELEPLDPAIAAAEERRAAEAVEAHRKAIDINEVYRDFEANRDSEIVRELMSRMGNFRWQFRTKHLLILIALAAVMLVLWRAGIGLATPILLLVMGAVVGLTLFLKWEENKRQEEAERRRDRMYAERRATLARQSGQLPDEIDSQ